jgi:hypothetical protein
VVLIIPMRRKGVALFDRDKKRFELKLSVEKAPRRKSRIPDSGGRGPKGPWGR